MTVTMAVGLIIRVLDIVIGVTGLLLIVRVLLQVFGMRWDHPVLKGVSLVTDPVLAVSNRILGIPSYRSSYRLDTSRTKVLNAAAAILLLWATRTLAVWLLQLVVLVPTWVVRPLGSIESMLRYLLRLAFDLYGMALFVRVLFSWIQVPYSSRLTRFLWTITEPLLAPIRRALPPLGFVDLSPLVAFFLLRLLQQVVFTLLSWVF
jgi:YggT family protein